MKNKVSVLFVIVFAIPIAFFMGPMAHGNQYGFSKDTLVTYFESSYFLTKANFDPNGNSIGLPAGNQFSEYRFNLSGSYDLSNRLSFYANGSFKRTDAITNTGVFGAAGLSETTNTNFADFVLGGNFLLLSKFVTLVPDVSVSIPSYPQAGTNNGPLLGDGAFVGTFKMYATKRWRSLLLSAYGGYSYRNYGFSSLIPYGAVAHYEWGNIFLEGGAEGGVSLNNDQYQSFPLYRVTLTNAYDAGSLVYAAINPSWVNGNITVGYRFSPWFFATAGINQCLVGDDVAQGTRFLIGLGYSNTPTQVFRRHGGIDSSDHQGSGNFEVDTDKEDSVAPQNDEGPEDKSRKDGKIIAPIH